MRVRVLNASFRVMSVWYLKPQTAFWALWHNVSLCISSGTRCLYKRAHGYARRPLATWSIMWSTLHPVCPSSPPTTSRHRPPRPTASAWTPHRKCQPCWTLDKILTVRGKLPFILWIVVLDALTSCPLSLKLVPFGRKKPHQPLKINFTVNKLPHQ